MAENVHSKYLEFLRGGESSLGQLLDEALKRGLPMEGRAGLLPFRDTLPGSVMNERSWALPGVLAGAVNAFSAPGRALTGSDPGFQQGPEAMNFAGNLLGSSLAAAPLSGRPRLGELGITAYHGSPHKFDAFDASKIGTGEGAQAYGHGLYFAENPAVAKSYAEDLGRKVPAFNGVPVKDSVESMAHDILTKYDPATAKKVVDSYVAGGVFKGTDAEVMRQRLYQSIDKFSSAKADVANTGALYKADIPDAMIQKMLDWDKPLSEQTPFVRDALKKLGIEHGSGQDVVTHLGGKTGQKYLTDVGIPGIRYLDQGSRFAQQPHIQHARGLDNSPMFTVNGPKGDMNFGTMGEAQNYIESLRTRNYVVFPGMEQNVKILEKK